MTPLYQQWLSTFPNPQEKLDAIGTKSLWITHDQSRRNRGYGNLSAFDTGAHITGQHLPLTADTFTLIVHWNRKKQNENFGAG